MRYTNSLSFQKFAILRHFIHLAVGGTVLKGMFVQVHRGVKD